MATANGAMQKAARFHAQGIRGNALNVSALTKLTNFANCHKMSKIPRIPWTR